MVAARNDEAGFTLVEVLIAMMLTALTAASIFGILVTQSNTERRTTDLTVNLEEIRQALVYLQRDLRSAEPIVGITDVTQYAYRVDLDVYDDITSTVPQQVSWRIDTASDELRRDVLHANGIATTTYRLKGVKNHELGTGAELFRYFNEKGEEFKVLTEFLTPHQVAYCTVRVRVDLRASPNGSPAPARIESDVMLRNKLPGAVEC